VNPSALTRAEGTAFDMGAMIGQITNPGDATAVVGQSGSGDSGPPLALDPVINHLPLDSVRRYLARAGVAMFLDHPLTGVGLGGFQPEILGPYFDYVPLDRHSAPVSLPHTEAIRIAAETGLVGILASVFFLGAILWSLARAASRAPHVRPAAIAIGLGVLAIGIASQFEGRLFDEPYLWLLIGLTGGLAMVPVLAARDVRPTAEP
jgi:O-antigen ligase